MLSSLTKGMAAVVCAMMVLGGSFAPAQEAGRIQPGFVVNGSSSASMSVSTSERIEASSERTFLAAISSRPGARVTAVRGLGANWQQVVRQCSGRNSTYVEIWLATGEPVSNEPVIAEFSEVTDNAVISVSGYSGVQAETVVGAMVAGNSNGIQGTCTGGVDGNSYDLSLETTVAGGLIYSAAAMRSRSHIPGTGFTEIDEIHSGDRGKEASIATQIREVDLAGLQDIRGRFNRNVDWAAAAFELKPDSTNIDSSGATQVALTTNTTGIGTISVDPPGGVYIAGQEITIMASPEEDWQFTAWSGDLSGTTNPLVVTITSDLDITANFIEIPIRKFRLQVETAGQGRVDVLPNQEFFDEETGVTLIAEAATGWRFDSWSGDHVSSRNPDTIIMDADKVIRANFIDNSAGESVRHEETQSGISSGQSQVTTASSLTGVGGHLYLASVSTRPRRSVVAIAGLDLKWRRVVEQCSGRGATGVEIWYARGNDASTEPVTVTLTSATDNAAFAVSRYSGVSIEDPFVSIVAGNSNGRDGTCGRGTDTATYALDLGQISSTHLVYGATAIRNKIHEPGPGFLERSDIRAGTTRVAGLVVQDIRVPVTSNVSVSGSFEAAVDWATIGIEILPAAASDEQFRITAEVDLPQGGKMIFSPQKETYNRGESVLVTSAPSDGYVFVGWQGDLSGFAGQETLVMTSNRFVKALFQQIPTPRTDSGILFGTAELATLPVSGPAWTVLLAEADKITGPPNVSNKDDSVNVRVLAKALAFARIGGERYRSDVIAACVAAIGTEAGGRTLALGRELLAYVIAADIVKLPGPENTAFKNWLRQVRARDLQGRTLQTTHEDRPNNWGTNAGATRAAIALYLEDWQDLARTALVFKGYLGDRAAYAEFDYGELSWQHDPLQPVGINPKGATKDGYSIDGVMPDDMRRGASFQVPPAFTGYPWGALQGVVVLAEILYRAGYDSWSWEEQAILRSVQFLQDLGWEATGDDTWIPWMINLRYGTNIKARTPTISGKNFGWTDWLYGGDFGLNVTTSGQGSGKIDICSLGFDQSSRALMRLHALPRSGSLFAGWSGDFTGTENPAVLDLSKNMNVVALFNEREAEQVVLTVSTTGPGTVQITPPAAAYDLGSVVHLLAIPDSGFVFSGWRDDVLGSENPVQITMNGDRQVTALFSSPPVEKTLIFQPSDDAYVKSGLNLNYGDRNVLKVRLGGSKFYSFLKFQVTGSAGKITSARLRLFATENSPDGGGLYVVANELRDSGEAWNETNLVWSNAPLIGETPFRSGTPTQFNTWVEFDVSSLISGDGTYSFALKNNDAGVARYSSKEGDQPPELVLETAPSAAQTAPEGATAAGAKVRLTANTELPEIFALGANYPNPFNAGTTMEYAVARESRIQIAVFNISGQLVRKLVDEVQTAGFKSMKWDGRNQQRADVSSGVYFLRLNAGGKVMIRKMLLQR